jgi:hypothetical protein
VARHCIAGCGRRSILCIIAGASGRHATPLS